MERTDLSDILDGIPPTAVLNPSAKVIGMVPGPRFTDADGVPVHVAQVVILEDTTGTFALQFRKGDEEWYSAVVPQNWRTLEEGELRAIRDASATE